MKKKEVIELDGTEYTLTFNRDCALKIEQYTNTQETWKEINKPLIEYKDTIAENENPFANENEIEEYQKKADTKMLLIKKSITRAFWLWLYPDYKFSISKVEEILNSYFEDDEKISFITEKYFNYLQKSSEITTKYIEEEKNLSAQTNK